MEKYIITDKLLGKGGFGKVFLALDKATQKQEFAIKIIEKQKVNMKMVKNEIQILLCCQHENIIKIYDYWEDQVSIYITMEYAGGGELFQHIVKRDHFTENHAMKIIRQIVSAVCYLHLNNVSHMDIKPENILLKQVPKEFNNDTQFIPITKLTDFGLASFITSGEKLSAVGTPGYAAPEVLMNHSYKHQPDIYSIGVLTYVMIAGHLPYKGDTPQQWMEETKNGSWSFSNQFDGISIECKDFIHKCMKFDPAQRPTAMQLTKHPWLSVVSPVNIKNKDQLRRLMAQTKMNAAVKLIALSQGINRLIGDK